MKLKKALSLLLAIALLIGLVPAVQSSAAKKVSITPKSKTLTVNDDLTVYLKNNTKTPKWSVSNKNISISYGGFSYARIRAEKAGTSTITAKIGKKKYSCKIKIKDNQSEIKSFTVDKKVIYDQNGIKITTDGIERKYDCFSMDFIIENNTEKNYNGKIYYLAINDGIDQDAKYYSSVNIPAGKKARYVKTIEFEVLNKFEITNINVISLIFSFWDDDDNADMTEEIDIHTSIDNGKNYFPNGKKVYSDSNIDLWYINGKNYEYSFAIHNKTDATFYYTIDDCAIDDWAYNMGSNRYEMYNETLLNRTYDVFTIKVDNDFLSTNKISSISKIEFTVTIGYDNKTEKISIDV